MSEMAFEQYIKIRYTYTMTIKFNDIVSKADWIKISILIIISAGCWIWVWQEYQKPILPEGLDAPIVKKNLETQ